MKIAYIILAHKYPEQLVRLITKLDAEQTSFWVHIDKKTSKKTYQAIVSQLNNKSNVYLLKRQNVYWGDFSQVGATYNGIKEIIQTNISFDYVKLLSGQDYPIKSRIKIESLLKKSNKKSFIQYFPLPYDKWEGGEKNGGLDRLTYFYLRIFNNRYQLPFQRKFPKSFKPFAGSAYWFLSQECAEYVHLFVQQNPAFVNFFKNVTFSDESFFQTIILNSPFKENVINDDLTYADWLRDSPHPEVLDKNYLEILSKSPSLFARKFDIKKDSDVLDFIDKNILNDMR